MPEMMPVAEVFAVRDESGNEGTSGVVKYTVTVTNTGNIALDLEVTVTVAFVGDFSSRRSSTGGFGLSADASVSKVVNVTVTDADPVGDILASAFLHAPGDPDVEFNYDFDPGGKVGEITPPDGVIVPPTAFFTWEQDPDTTLVNFDASGSTPGNLPIAAYVWNWGDGAPISFGTVPKVSHVYPFVDAVYPVTLWVFDSNNSFGRWDRDVPVSVPGR